MLSVSKTDVWAAPIDDKPGGITARLRDLVLKANLNLQFLIAQRITDQPGTGALFLLPVSGEKQEAAAAQAGFVRNHQMCCLRVIGGDEPGIAYRILSTLADKGLNLRAVTTAVLRDQFVMYLTLDTPADADVAARLLMTML